MDFRPHERDLTPEKGISEPNKGDTWLFQDVDDAVAIVLAEAGPDWATFLKAAPVMARALLVVLDSGVDSTWKDRTGTRVNMRDVVTSALREAGVPLP